MNREDDAAKEVVKMAETCLSLGKRHSVAIGPAKQVRTARRSRITCEHSVNRSHAAGVAILTILHREVVFYKPSSVESPASSTAGAVRSTGIALGFGDVRVRFHNPARRLDAGEDSLRGDPRPHQTADAGEVGEGRAHRR